MKKRYLLLGSLTVYMAALLVSSSHAYADNVVFDETEYNAALADHIEQSLIMKDEIDESIKSIS